MVGSKYKIVFFMKEILLTTLFGIVGQCYAGTFDLDTIDNWQVYNGTEIVLAGHDLHSESLFLGSIKISELKDLSIQFNHDTETIDTFIVVIDITDKKGNILLTSEFKSGPGIRFAFRKKKLEKIKSEIIIIRYREEREGGANKILGEIRLE
jgi:hypothetical protein